MTHIDAEIIGQIDRVAFVGDGIQRHYELCRSLSIFDDYYSKRQHRSCQSIPSNALVLAVSRSQIAVM